MNCILNNDTPLCVTVVYKPMLCDDIPLCVLGRGRLVIHWWGHISKLTGCSVPSLNPVLVSCTCTIPFAPWKKNQTMELTSETQLHIHEPL